MTRQISIILFIASAIFTVVYGTLLFNVHIRQELFRVTSYYFIFLSFFIWLALVISDITFKKEHFIKFLKDNILAISISAALIIIVIISVGGHFRVLSDETNMIGLSKSMFYNRTVENSIKGIWYYNVYHSLQNILDKRPNLFPFLISLVHTIRGYSAANGFIVNFIVSFLCLFNLYLLAKTIFSKNIGIAAILMTISYPVFVFSTTSAGFEMITLLFIIISFRFFYDYLYNKEANKLNKLLMTLVLLSQCRYEAAGVMIILVIFVFCIELKNDFKSIQPFIALIPILCLPVLWQRSTNPLIQAPAEVTAHPGLSPLGIRYVLPGISAFLKMFFSPMNNQYAAWIVSYLGTIGIVYGCLVFSRNIKFIAPQVKVFMLAFFLVLSYYFGSLVVSVFGKYVGQPYGCRYALIYVPLFALFAAFLINSLPISGSRWFPVIFLSAIFFFFFPVSITDLPSKSYVAGRGYELQLNFLKRYAMEDNVFIISEAAHLFTVQNFGAADFGYANRQKKTLMSEIERHLIAKVIVIQNISYNTHKPTKETELDPDYNLKTVLEIQNTPKEFLRFSVCENSNDRTILNFLPDNGFKIASPDDYASFMIPTTSEKK